jgi:hypothetical protein
MLGRYQKKCENQIGFQTGSQFETLSDALHETRLQGFM